MGLNKRLVGGANAYYSTGSFVKQPFKGLIGHCHDGFIIVMISWLRIARKARRMSFE
ncbi:hypothetical protein ANABIO32_37030 [Rossellomorea marisflavi]|nr:hypothetical protein ANABIO32_37030 [Rossellomorea marisflavi]